MQYALLLLGLHVLFWGALGVAVARRACLSPWLCAGISVLVPVLGAAGLLIYGSTGDRRARRAALAPLSRNAAAGLVGFGVMSAAVLLVSGWLPGVTGEVGGEVAGTVGDEVSVASTDSLGLALYSTLLGLLLAGLVVATWRLRHRYLIPLIVTLAGVPALIANFTLWGHAVATPWVDRASAWGRGVAEVNDTEVAVHGSLSIGAGPVVALVGGALVLVWALLWCAATTPARTRRASVSAAAASRAPELGAAHSAPAPATPPSWSDVDPWAADGPADDPWQTHGNDSGSRGVPGW